MKKYVAPALIVVSLLVAGTVGFVYKDKLLELFGKNDLLMEGHFVSKSGTELVTIGDVSQIEGIWFEVTLKNTGDIPLNAYIEESTPIELYDLFDKSVKVIQPGEQVVWASGVLDVSDYGFGDNTFYVKIKQDFVCPSDMRCKTSSGTTVEPGQPGVIYSEGFVTYNIQPDQAGVGSEFSFEGGVGESSTGVPDTGDTSCLLSGLTCSSNSDCCAGVCESETTFDETIKSCLDYKSVAGCTCTNGANRCTITEFTCLNKCNIYQVETKTGPTTWIPLTPMEFVKSCTVGVCKFISTTANGYAGYDVQSITINQCQ